MTSEWIPASEEGKVANGEILYLYEAKDTNPNGDPDSENRPRMDHVAGRILVSDVRLKRYVREYLLNRGRMSGFASRKMAPAWMPTGGGRSWRASTSRKRNGMPGRARS